MNKYLIKSYLFMIIPSLIFSQSQDFYNNIQAVKLITYTDSGNDKTWFTNDDTESRMKINHYNQKGEVLQSEIYLNQTSLYNDLYPEEKGVTKKWVLEEYTQYTFDANRIIQYIKYGNAGADKKWFTPDDKIRYYKKYTYDANNVLKSETIYVNAGEDGKWFSKDDGEYININFFYDKNGENILTELVTLTPGEQFPEINKKSHLYLCIKYFYNNKSQIIKKIAFNNGTNQHCSYNTDTKYMHIFEYDKYGNKSVERIYNDKGEDQILNTNDDLYKQIEYSYTDHIRLEQTTTKILNKLDELNRIDSYTRYYY